MEMSESILDLAKALNILQGQLMTVPKEKINPFHQSKYADLSAIWEMCRQPLAANGLSLVQTTEVIENNVILETTLLHSSGQWLRGKLSLNPVKLDPQGIGSALTYGRRYAMCAMLGIAADADDDAEGASSHPGDKRTAANSKSSEKKAAMDSDWLKRSLKSLNWNPLDWIKETFKINGETVSAVLALMSVEQKAAFAAEIRKRLTAKEVKK
jgi:hypothetical protein